jgi:hypothetical protein
MKTIALLAIGAALALAADQDGKKTADTKTTNTKTTAAKTTDKKTSDTKTPSAEAARMKARQSAVEEPSRPAQRKVHQPTVNPAAGKLTPAQQAAAALPTVPPGAQEVGSNLYRYTDSQGKVWMYRKTPFGVSKWEEKPGQQAPQAEPPNSAGTTMTDLGDSVQFQRATPFGPQKWVRKKSEMSDDEKAAFATQEHAKQAALGNTLGTKPADAAKPPEQH